MNSNARITLRVKTVVEQAFQLEGLKQPNSIRLVDSDLVIHVSGRRSLYERTTLQALPKVILRVIGRHHHVTSVTIKFSDDAPQVEAGRDPDTARAERRLRIVAVLLPPMIRTRQIAEWIDELESQREAGGNVSQVLRSIVLRSVIPIAIRARVRILTRAVARTP